MKDNQVLDNMKIKPKLIVILGPTASGKSVMAIKLAKKFNGEIVSVDSRQVYKKMDIVTAKPLRENKRNKRQEYLVGGIPHYLIDVVRPNQEFNVAIYKKLAIEKIKNIQKRGKLPFLVGGTGLYIRAIVDDIKFPNVPPQKKLREELKNISPKELFEIYQKLDPEGAKFIEKENKIRLIRAIEVCKTTKKPFWEQRKKGKILFNILQMGIKLQIEDINKRISKRVEKMIKMGLEKEVKNNVKKYGWEVSPMHTIGYQEWLPFMKGLVNRKEVKENIKSHTLQFAKRQITWFKKDKRIHWVKNYKEAEKLVKEFLK